MGFLPTVLLRNPRYAILLAVILVGTLTFFLPGRPAVDVADYFSSSSSGKHASQVWVKEALREEEVRYEGRGG